MIRRVLKMDTNKEERDKEEDAGEEQEPGLYLLSALHPHQQTSPVCIALGGSSRVGHGCETNIALLHSENTEWETKQRMKQAR